VGGGEKEKKGGSIFPDGAGECTVLSCDGEMISLTRGGEREGSALKKCGDKAGAICPLTSRQGRRREGGRREICYTLIHRREETAGAQFSKPAAKQFDRDGREKEKLILTRVYVSVGTTQEERLCVT